MARRRPSPHLPEGFAGDDEGGERKTEEREREMGKDGRQRREKDGREERERERGGESADD